MEKRVQPVEIKTTADGMGEETTYIFDYRNTLNCTRLVSLIRDKTGKERTMEVLVRPESDSTAKPILAMATSNPAKKSIDIVVTTKAGRQDFTADYDDVLFLMSQEHPDRNW